MATILWPPLAYSNCPLLYVIFSHILLCNILTTILRPNFEEPLDTAKQLVDQNITIYMFPDAVLWREFMLESPIPEYGILAKNMIIADDWDHFYKISENDTMGNGTHANLTPWLDIYELDMGRWYRSKEKFEDEPYFGFLSNKKWHLKEVIISQIIYIV